MMLKHGFILLLGTYILFGSPEDNQPNKDIIFDVQVASCPETDGTEIFVVHGILTTSQLEVELEKVGLDTFPLEIDQTELSKIPNLQDYLHDYWHKNGINEVSDPELCQKISETLEGDPQSKNYLEDHNRVYYKVKNRYLIVYQRKQIGTRNVKVPWQIMNEDFEIIGDFRL